jgi:hypothetical protein
MEKGVKKRTGAKIAEVAGYCNASLQNPVHAPGFQCNRAKWKNALTFPWHGQIDWEQRITPVFPLDHES